MVIATGRRADDKILGVDVGDPEDHTFWRQFLTNLVDCGLAEVKLITDLGDTNAAHERSRMRCRAPVLLSWSEPRITDGLVW